MKLEKFISDMMSLGVYGRLCHWATSSAQHHTTFESFLTQNEQFTDSFVESALGNDVDLKIEKISINVSLETKYDLNTAKEMIKTYRTKVSNMQQTIGNMSPNAEGELISVLDDLVELCSKTLYLLKLK